MQPKTNVGPLKTATRPKRLPAPKAARLTTACYKACDKDHSTVDWYTPPTIVEALGGKEGFDLDPCTPEDPSRLPAPTARRMITPRQDGLATAWCPRAFDSMLAHLLLTFQHRAGVSSYTSSFDLAQTCVFGKQLPGPILCGSLS